jgi:hypothetical protein
MGNQSKEEFTSHHVGVAAEAISAAQFARIGYHVSVQYGANQPGYDLMVNKGIAKLSVSVKGSNDGSWGLTQNHLENANYYEAIDKWLSKHSEVDLFCFVQFQNEALSEMARVYIASPSEVAKRLKETRNGEGDTILHEEKVWKKGKGEGTSDKIPDSWLFSKERMDNFIK